MEHPEREGFGEASLGEAQSSDPPPDPEMVEDEEDEDAGPATTPEDLDESTERDQAEG
ncbi:MAG TPA: hypothetical protein VK326_08315 [Solirubrobacterales bacterium]|nr:hypothetical protein [Solirubrobacterales bacterium]